jgi:hypothetical protein
MSIVIRVDYRDANGEWQPIELDAEGHLAGHEVARVQLWGAPIMRQLGLTLLPQLANGQPLSIEGEPLAQLETEARVVLANVPLIIANTTYPRNNNMLIHRAENILYAALNAIAYDGRVWIG